MRDGCRNSIGQSRGLLRAQAKQVLEDLHETRLAPEPLQPHQYRSLLQHGIGLTDLVKADAGMDRATLPKLTAADRARLSKAIATFRPQFLAFTSKTAGQKFFNGNRDYGEQSDLIGDTRV